MGGPSNVIELFDSSDDESSAKKPKIVILLSGDEEGDEAPVFGGIKPTSQLPRKRPAQRAAGGSASVRFSPGHAAAAAAMARAAEKVLVKVEKDSQESDPPPVRTVEKDSQESDPPPVRTVEKDSQESDPP